MAQLSLTEVSKRFNVNRTTVYRAVSNGKLSRLNNGMFDLAEVIRVFGEAPTPVKSNDNETPIVSDIQNNETPYEANSNDTKQHDATVKRGLFDRIDRGLKAFLK